MHSLKKYFEKFAIKEILKEIKKDLSEINIDFDKFTYESGIIKKNHIKKVFQILKNNKIVSLVSDAGTPAVSDPGRILVQECVKNKINIFPIPGASAVSSAISISGFSDNFYFEIQRHEEDG